MIRPLRVVALDLSLRGTGIAVTHASDGEPWPSCRTVSPPKYPTANIIDHRRLNDIFQQIKTAVGCKPDLVIIEWLPLIAGKGDTSLRVAELHGAIKHWLFSQGHRYVDVRPQELKTYAAGNANASKERVRDAVMNRYAGRLHVSSFDEADATTLMALALDAYGQPLTNRDGSPIPVPPAHRAAVGKVVWPDLLIRAAS